MSILLLDTYIIRKIYLQVIAVLHLVVVHMHNPLFTSSVKYQLHIDSRLGIIE